MAVWKALAALGLHGALVVWLTWPLASALSTHLPLTAAASLVDPLLVAFTLAHESRTLLTDPMLLAHAPMFHPAPWALYYGEASFGALPLFAGPFLLTGNPTLALNLVLLGGLTLTAWALHLTTAARGGSWLGGLVAGVTYLTTPFVLVSWMPVAPNYAVMFYLPAIMMLAATPMAGARSMLALLVLIILQGLVSVYFVAAVMGPLVIIALFRLARAETRAAGARLAVVLATALLVLGAAFWGYLVVRWANPALSSQTPYPRIGLHCLRLPFGALAAGQPGGIAPAGFIVIALGALALAGRARHDSIEPRVRAAWGHAALWMVMGILMAAVPAQSTAGIPLLSAIRARPRLALDTLIGLAVLSGLAFAELSRFVGRRRDRPYLRWIVSAPLAVLIVVAMYLGWGRPFGPQARAGYGSYEAPVRDGPILRALRQSDGPLLELPTGEGLVPHAVAMYRAIYHRLPLLNGYNGYWPDGFAERMELACRLPDHGALEELVNRTGVSLILVHVGILGPPPGRPPNKFSLPYGCPTSPVDGKPAQWLNIARRGGDDLLRLVASEGTDRLFAVKARIGSPTPPPRELKSDFSGGRRPVNVNR